MLGGTSEMVDDFATRLCLIKAGMTGVYPQPKIRMKRLLAAPISGKRMEVPLQPCSTQVLIAAQLVHDYPISNGNIVDRLKLWTA